MVTAAAPPDTGDRVATVGRSSGRGTEIGSVTRAFLRKMATTSTASEFQRVLERVCEDFGSPWPLKPLQGRQKSTHNPGSFSLLPTFFFHPLQTTSSTRNSQSKRQRRVDMFVARCLRLSTAQLLVWG